MWLPVRGKVPVALTIAGSDSGGGAGIEADLKTFAAMGVHGVVALSAITAQNTVAVTGVQDVNLNIIEKQIDAVINDIGVDAAKTGMLHTKEIIELVAKKVSSYDFPLVVDPVMVAKSGAPLLKKDAIQTLIEKLIPIAKIITPNAREAEVIVGYKVENLEDAKRAAKDLLKLGCEAVIVKGGHLKHELAVDILYYKDKVYIFEDKRIETRNTHGTGCSFSAAIAAGLAKGLDIVKAVKEAKKLLTTAIKYSLSIGKGYGPVNPLALLYLESEKWRVYERMVEAIRIIEENQEITKLIPEVGMNIAMALPEAESESEVMGVPGRIVNVKGKPRASAPPIFGGSKHLARYITSIIKLDPNRRAAVNIRYNERVLEILRGKGMLISFYDRSKEPMEVKRVEGATIPWGVKEAVKRVGGVPDVIYHRGDWGKEPMIVILGQDPVELAELLVEIARGLGD